MPFGEEILRKYGWKEGQGLGKKENGIAIPIKSQLKFNTNGMGYNKADEFSFQWWDHVYNKAANNMCINKSELGEITIKKEADTKVSKSLWNGDSESGYGSFVKGTVKCDQSKELIKNFTDDELFKLCGSLTGHKGARHGIKMTGKLSRVEAQDKAFLIKYAGNSELKESAHESAYKNDKSSKPKRKKSRKDYNSCENDNSEANFLEIGGILQKSNETIKQKEKNYPRKEKTSHKADKTHKLKRNLKEIEDNSSQSSETVRGKDLPCESIESSETTISFKKCLKKNLKKSKKSYKSTLNLSDSETIEVKSNNYVKDKINKKQNSDEIINSNLSDSETLEIKSIKNGKKKKTKKYNCDINTTLNLPHTETEKISSKKHNKKKKNKFKEETETENLSKKRKKKKNKCKKETKTVNEIETDNKNNKCNKVCSNSFNENSPVCVEAVTENKIFQQCKKKKKKKRSKK